MRAQFGGGDFIYVMFFFFLLVIILFFFTLVSNQIKSTLKNVTGYNQVPMCNGSPCFNQSTTPYNATVGLLNLYPQFDNYIPWLFILINLAIIASAVLLFSNFLAYAIGFLVMIITDFISIILSNEARNIFLNPLFGNVIQLYPHIQSMFQQLPIYEIVFTFIYLIIIAAKSRIIGASGYTSSSQGATL